MAKNILFANITALGIGSFFSKLAVFLMLPLYTAVLTPAEFGTVDILLSTAALLIPLVSLGAPEAYFRFVAGGTPERAVTRLSLRFFLVGFSILLAFLPFLALFGVLRPYLPYLFLYILASVWHSFGAHRLRARGAYGMSSIQQLFCTLATVLLALLFLPVLNLGVKGYLLAILSADAVTALILQVYLRATRPVQVETSTPLARPFTRYALPLVPTALLWWALSYFDRYILLATHGESAVGIYAAAGKLPALLTFAASVFMEAWHFSAIHAPKERRSLLFSRIYGALLPCLIAFVLFLVLFARPMVKILFASDFEAAAPFVPILALAALFTALSSFLGSIYVVKLRSGAALFSAALAVLVNLVLDLLLIPSLGAFGAAIATLASSTALFFARSIHARRVMPFYQHSLPLFFSFFALTLTAILSLKHSSIAFFGALIALLPFWREICAIFRFLSQIPPKFLKKRTKNAKIP